MVLVTTEKNKAHTGADDVIGAAKRNLFGGEMNERRRIRFFFKNNDFLSFGAKNALEKLSPIGASGSSSLRRRSFRLFRRRRRLLGLLPVPGRHLFRLPDVLFALFILFAFPGKLLLLGSTFLIFAFRPLAPQHSVRLLLPELVQPAGIVVGRRRVVRLDSLEHLPRLLGVAAEEVGLAFGLRHLGSHLLRVRGPLVGKPLAEVGPLEPGTRAKRRNTTADRSTTST